MAELTPEQQARLDIALGRGAPAAIHQSTAEQAQRVNTSITDAITGSNAVDSVLQEPPTELAPLTVTASAPGAIRPNPLHEYTSYTYGISLHLLTAEEHRLVVRNQEYTPNRVLIASAGRRSGADGDFARDRWFTEDFYFDEFSLETVIGLNETSRAANAVSMNFKIIEPYGMTLFERIISANLDIGSPNYLASPYLIQIDFFAINDEGVIVGNLPQHVKRIPVKLIKFDIKASASGAEYQVEAIPFNHSAYDQTAMSTPANFEITARTVEDFFGNTGLDDLVDLNAAIRENFDQQIFDPATGSVRRVAVPSALLSNAEDRRRYAEAKKPLYQAQSYSSALNSWSRELLDTRKILAADEYRFKFYGPIGKAVFADVASNEVDVKNVPLTQKVNAAKNAKANAGAAVAEDNQQRRIFTVSTGTSIDAVINYVIRHSSYIQDQLEDPQDLGRNPQKYAAKIAQNKSSEDLPLNWFKIIPTVELGNYDHIRKNFARRITYHVVPYAVYNTKISVAPQGTVKDPIKEYNYLYTGQNLDVLDFNIEFNALYYTAITAFKERIERRDEPVSLDQIKKNPEQYTEAQIQRALANAVQPMSEIPVVYQSRTQATGMEGKPKGVAAADTQESLYTNAGADMLSVTMRILGDPEFIKQDDIFYTPDTLKDRITGDFRGILYDPESDIDLRVTANGSIITDYGEVYVRINFDTPVDVDETTGLMKFGEYDFDNLTVKNNRTRSVFSGLYRVLTVSSEFRAGKFEQTLNLVRLPRQDRISVNDTSEGQRNENEPAKSREKIKNVDSEDASQQAIAASSDNDGTRSGIDTELTLETETVPEDLQQISPAIRPIQDSDIRRQVNEPPVQAPVVPSGVTQSNVTGNYEFAGVVIPPSVRPNDLSLVVAAMEAGNDITVNDVDPVTGQPRLTTYNSSTNSFTTKLGQ